MNVRITNLRKVLFLSSALFFNSAFADNTLNLGEGVNLIIANGEEASSGSLFGKRTSYKLPNGINQIAVNYTAEIKKGGDYELESSNVFVLLFNSKNKELRLTAPEIKRLKDLRKFEQSMNWSLSTNNGKAVAFKASLIKREGMQLSRDLKSEIKEFNQSNSEAVLPKEIKISENILHSTEKEQFKNKTIEPKDNTAAKMLIYWYNQADAETRKSFKELINNL